MKKRVPKKAPATLTQKQLQAAKGAAYQSNHISRV